ncbi:tRNA (adenosine(37)-N6)-threonylcarbamoyltransferase complex ATPase subunit type 1 TsaE [Leptolyngbya sp. 'hensonii']|uniref:tRNA (adenosine(37)-N6)-threonylcarbamoyltransferase complex ATPase subunit type 1 TsaE n=1 Tax=Leptolyngbya sp. 'hensonii' TaxID=1922337 RepID=UPI0009502F76|nr:tRNA (adenosine(37)-N6)-threonylcarbamoyltransferase complex ATPase subunit type 1 TsaE [Leptolyngbya sp. 'hensonii']OLP16164.1 tRNA (adenosine(37)-N6)-threonylcarbamoyltransferase complex ATPase subunit type 1 TsaE [Leptolyngbya sp. 'hensonii']
MRNNLPVHEVLLTDAGATHRLGVRLGESLPAGTVLLLQGDLGSGKTTLVQGIAAGLGLDGPIESPTFTLINEYLEGRLPLYHLDLYRLEPPEIVDLHLEVYWEGREVEPGLVAIEWADRLPYIPASAVKLVLTYEVGGARRVQWSPIGEESEAVMAALLQVWS